MKLVLKEEYAIRQSGTGRAIGLPPLWAKDLLPGVSVRIFEDADSGALIVEDPSKPIESTETKREGVK